MARDDLPPRGTVPPKEVDSDEVIAKACKLVFEAAILLCRIESLYQDEEEDEEERIRLARAVTSLRDVANSLSPDRPAWPKGGAAIFDIKSGMKVN